MKVILSRKGLDSSFIDKASPIINDRFVSIPIPQVDTGIMYKDLYFDSSTSYLQIMKDLGINRFTEAHLDPDLRMNIKKNRTAINWKAAFGQDDNAQHHLNEKAFKYWKEGEENVPTIFLFFGWFSFAEKNKDKYVYKHIKEYRNGFHAIYGYLEVDKKIEINNENINEIRTKYPYLIDHPHIKNYNDFNEKNNTVYIAKNSLSFNSHLKGFGVFKYNESLVLSEKNNNRSTWLINKCFAGKDGNVLMSHITEKYEKTEIHDKIRIKSNGRGQELVIENNVDEWLEELFRNNKIED